MILTFVFNVPFWVTETKFVPWNPENKAKQNKNQKITQDTNPWNLVEVSGYFGLLVVISDRVMLRLLCFRCAVNILMSV